MGRLKLNGKDRPLLPSRLIQLVRDCPELWNTAHPDYLKTPVAKEIKWREIAAVIEMPPKILKSKWKNLRDSYAKHLRALANKDEASSRRFFQYAWAPEMQFIAPFLKLRPGVDVLQDHGNEGGCNESPLTTRRIKTEKRPVKRRRRRPPPSPPAAAAPAPETSYQGLRDLDANELIFHGYAKIVKKFSARRKLETRSKIMQILAEAEAQHLEESGAEESEEEQEEEEPEEEEEEGRWSRRRERRPDPLVAKLEPMDPDDDSRYFES